MIIICFISLALILTCIIISNIERDDTVANIFIPILVFVFIFSIFLIISTLVTMRDMKEVINNPQRYSSVELSKTNKSVAGIKRSKFLYYGFNLDGIEFIELDSAGAIKVSEEELEK